MKTWTISAIITVSALTEVEAETELEALEIASERSVVLAGRAEYSECFIIEEADGEPYDFEVVK